MIKVGRKYLFFTGSLNTDPLESLAAGICLVKGRQSKYLYDTKILIELMKGPPPVVIMNAKRLNTSHKDYLLPMNAKNSQILMKWIFKD